MPWNQMQPNFKCLPLTSIVNVNWEKSEHSSIRNFRISRLTHLNFILNKLNHVLPPATCLIDVHSWHLLFDHFQFALIHGPDTLGSYAILLFTASDLASFTSPIRNWVLFLLWFCLFILSGVISPLISSSILGTYQPGEFIFQYELKDHRKSKGFPEKHLILLYDYAKALDCVDHNKLWKILKEMGIPDHLTCLLRNLYAGQEATVRTGHGTTDWFQIGKGVHQGCIL